METPMSNDPAPPRTPLRLLVVDDHEVVREGLVALLSRREEFQVVAEAGSVAESIAAARRFEPDLVVMDVRLPDGSGIEACRDIRAEFPAMRIVMLTSQERKILLLVAEGKTNKEIATDVFLSDKTVKNYVSSILSKLSLQRRAQAAAFVAKHRLGDNRS